MNMSLADKSSRHFDKHAVSAFAKASIGWRNGQLAMHTVGDVRRTSRGKNNRGLEFHDKDFFPQAFLSEFRLER